MTVSVHSPRSESLFGLGAGRQNDKVLVLVKKV